MERVKEPERMRGTEREKEGAIDTEIKKERKRRREIAYISSSQ